MESKRSKSKVEEQGSKYIVTSNKAFFKHMGKQNSGRAGGSCRLLRCKKVNGGRK